jgi:tetratricopeptide (TPR) repeat protein
MAVGLKFEQRMRIFDAALIDSDAPHHGFLALSLRQYLAADMGNRGLEARKMDEAAQAEAQLTWAQRLDSDADMHLLNLGAFWLWRNDPKKAFGYADAVLQLNTQNAEGFLLRALTYKDQKNNVAALKDINSAISLNNKNYMFYLLRGELLMNKGEFRDGERDFVVALQLSPREAGKTLSNTIQLVLTLNWLETPDHEKINSFLEKETGLRAIPSQTAISLAHLYWRAGQREYALELVETFLSFLSPAREKFIQEGKEFSETTLNFLKDLHYRLPPAMTADLEFKALWDPLGLPTVTPQ